MPGKQLSHGSHRGPGSHTASRPPSPRSLSTLSAPTLGIAPQCSHQQGPSCQQLKASTRYWAGQQPPRLRDEDQLAWSHGQPGTEARSLVMVPCSGPSRETCRCGLSRVEGTTAGRFLSLRGGGSGTLLPVGGRRVGYPSRLQPSAFLRVWKDHCVWREPSLAPN